MRYQSIALLMLATLAMCLAVQPDAIAHGVHAPATEPVGTLYAEPAGASWWSALYGSVEKSISSMLTAANEGGGLGSYLAILFLAFAYGVLHAVGPGHGKLLLASFMTATQAPVAVGISVAFAAAALQGAIAIAIVSVVAIGVQGAATLVPSLQGLVNTISLALLTALGILIVVRQLAALDWLPRPVARAIPASGCSCCSHGHHTHGGGHHHHGKHEHHDGPAAEEHKHLSAAGVVGLTASMGARPCTSAFAILLLALANDMLWFGVLATLAMAFGVAFTLVLVAVLSVDLREYAARAVLRSWLPENAMSLISLVAGTLLATVAFGGLVQAAIQ